jgi:hypothetical protein
MAWRYRRRPELMLPRAFWLLARLLVIAFG